MRWCNIKKAISSFQLEIMFKFDKRFLQVRFLKALFLVVSPSCSLLKTSLKFSSESNSISFSLVMLCKTQHALISYVTY